MKKLTPEQIGNITLEQAWDIASEFGEYLANGKPRFMEYEDVLPYPKDVTCLALVKILKEEDFHQLAITSGKTEKEMKEVIAANIAHLGSFIPTEEEYKKQVEIMEKAHKAFTNKYNQEN